MHVPDGANENGLVDSEVRRSHVILTCAVRLTDGGAGVGREPAPRAGGSARLRRRRRLCTAVADAPPRADLFDYCPILSPQKTETLPAAASPEPGRLRPSLPRHSLSLASKGKAPSEAALGEGEARWQSGAAAPRQVAHRPRRGPRASEAQAACLHAEAPPRPRRGGTSAAFPDASLLPWSSICDDHVLEVEREDRLARGKRKANEGLRASGVATEHGGIPTASTATQLAESAPRPKRLHFERSPAPHLADGAPPCDGGPGRRHARR